MAPPYSPPRHRPWMRRSNNTIIPADAPEYEGSERADQEPGGERADRLDERTSGGARREELHRQERGQAAEDVEVVPLDDVPDCCGDHDAPQILRGERRSGHNPSGRWWRFQCPAEMAPCQGAAPPSGR